MTQGEDDLDGGQPSPYAMERTGVGLIGKRILGTDCKQSRLQGLDGDGVSISLAPCDGAEIEAEKSEVQLWTVLQL